jgi:uncharacterized protein with HEPN domain
MAKPADRDAALLLDMLLAARDARGFVAGMDEAAFLASRLHQSAVNRALEVIGEAAGKVSPAFRAAQPAIPSREITGLRHRLIHGYDEVEFDVVWRVVTVRLESLIASLEPLIEQEGRPTHDPNLEPMFLRRRKLYAAQQIKACDLLAALLAERQIVLDLSGESFLQLGYGLPLDMEKLGILVVSRPAARGEECAGKPFPAWRRLVSGKGRAALIGNLAAGAHHLQASEAA